jgi:dienelactone hydrolase
MKIQTETISYVADGRPMQCRLYRDSDQKQPRPGVLVLPGASGLGPHCTDHAQRLAEQGFVTMAVDYYGDAYYDATYASPVTKDLYEGLINDTAKMRTRAGAALDALAARPEVDKSKLASMGYCFGGGLSMELAAAGAPIAAAIGFHSSFRGVTVAGLKDFKGRLLVCNGADDPIAPPDERAAFEAAVKGSGLKWHLHLYGGVVHSFTDPASTARAAEWARYDAFAAESAWNSMLFLLRDVFGR